MKTLIALALAISLQAKANIVCEVETAVGKAVVELTDSQIIVSGGALTEPQIFSDLTQNYDGHMTALVTGKGVSLSFENWYGCIHNATVITNFRNLEDSVGWIETVKTKQCKGGSTPDELCFRR